ncbi:MAG: M20/M25/M40 family metallo-hydrolase [Polaromonas sp.]|nr:M20/M25/M40 family metallo-hydrolase [Polaromonas sp.]
MKPFFSHSFVFLPFPVRVSALALPLIFAALLSPIKAVAQPAPAFQLDPAIAALAEKETAGLLETLRILTSFDSGTGQARGMLELVERIEAFAKNLGAEVQRVTPANGVVGPNLVMTFKGTGSKKIMLMSHMDTVYPPGTAAARPFRVDGDRAIAPGIADDKSGIAVFLHVMKMLKTAGFQDYERITMVFNSDEERGSSGSRDLIRSQAQAHDVILSGEPTGPNEAIVMGTSGVGQLSARLRVGGFTSSANSQPIQELADLILRSKDVQEKVAETRMSWTIARAQDARGLADLAQTDYNFATLDFRIKGRASHAGVAPGLGINAVVEMADLIRRTTAVAAQLLGAQLRWRIASGGLVSNIIPEQALAVAELALPKASDMSSALESLTRSATQPLLKDAQINPATSAGQNAKLSGPEEAFATADVRAPDAVAFASLAQAARQLIAAQKFSHSTIAVQDGLGFPAYNASAEGRQWAATAQAMYAALGGKLDLLPRTYGGTDAVWASQSGRPVVEGMGLPGGNYHSSEEEFILISRIPKRLALVAEMIRAVARR